MNQIKIIKNGSFVPDMNKSIHYISWTPINSLSRTGYSQLDYVDAIIRTNLPDYYPDPEDFYRMVDKTNEVGTLYPQICITILPSYGLYSDDEIYKQLDDIIHAQNEFIHAENVIFDMRNHSYFNIHSREYDNAEYLYMIYYNSHRFTRIAGKDVRIYAILHGDKVNWSFRGSDFYQTASDEEVEALSLHKP